MKLINSSFEILEQEPGLQGIYKQIELAGRTCYKSLDKITKDSAKDFVDRMINSKHYAMLEHGTVYLLFSRCCYDRHDGEFIDKYIGNPYSKVVYIGTDDNLVEQTPGKENYLGDILGTGVYGNALYTITTNYRVLVENDWLDDLQYLCEPTEHHEKRVTVKFITDRGVSHEFVRHRVFSFAQESTRYCNYSKDKFGNELTFIIPSWYNKETDSAVKLKFLDYLTTTEGLYLDLLRGSYWAKKVIEGGATYEKFENIEKVFAPLTPQQARQVLPNALKTELVMTGFVSDWKHLFRLRTSFIAETGKPHPDMSNLCDPLYKEFVKRGFIEK